MSLRVSNLNGQVTLTLPKNVGEATARAFVNDKRDWLARAVAGVPSARVVGLGGEIDYEGRRLQIRMATGRSVRLSGDGAALLVPEVNRLPGPAIKAWMRVQARDRLAEECDRLCRRLDRRYAKLTLRDTRSRWGSCSAAGGLMFSWRLIMAPQDVLNYVAAHEVAHLVEMNHGTTFWELVGELMPGYQQPRSWLKKRGAELHRWKFED
jgi:predicted metal-dependent hydrolase